jgi:hypothetical protein
MHPEKRSMKKERPCMDGRGITIRVLCMILAVEIMSFKSQAQSINFGPVTPIYDSVTMDRMTYVVGGRSCYPWMVVDAPVTARF